MTRRPVHWLARAAGWAGLALLLVLGCRAADQLIARPQPSAPPPADAVVLFAGETAAWRSARGDEAPVWQVDEVGALVATPGAGNLLTRDEWGDVQLHLEFNIPPLPDDHRGQQRGNSGVYLHGLYEVQILDMVGNTTYAKGGGGAIYEVADPLVAAWLPPGEWQSYDIFFVAPRFDAAGQITAPARMSVLWNGLWIHHNQEVPGPTRAALNVPPRPVGPIMLQDHGHRVRYRNIWLRPLAGEGR